MSFSAQDVGTLVTAAEIGLTALAEVPEPDRTDFLAFMLTQPRS